MTRAIEVVRGRPAEAGHYVLRLHTAHQIGWGCSGVGSLHSGLEG